MYIAVHFKNEPVLFGDFYLMQVNGMLLGLQFSPDVTLGFTEANRLLGHDIEHIYNIIIF